MTREVSTGVEHRGAAADAAVAASVWDRDRRALTIGLIVCVSMTAFEALAVATILPATVRDIGGLEWYGWAFSAFMLANLVGLSVAGDTADRRGAVMPFAAGSALFTIGLLGAGLAPTMLLLILGRTAQGFGAGGISCVAYLAVVRGYAPAARPHMMALLSSAWVVPGLVGPGLAGTIADHLDWRWVFLGLVPFTVVAAAWTAAALRGLGPSSAAGAGSQTLPALGLAAGAGAVLWGLDGQSVALAVPLVTTGTVIALPALRALLPAGTLHATAGAPAAIATLGLLSAAFFAAEAFLPLSLTAVRGQTTTMAGLALTAATLSWTGGAWIQARLAPRVRRRTITLAGLAIALAGIGGTAAIVLPAVPVLAAALTWGIAGLGMGLAFSTLVLEALDGAEQGAEGTASAALQLATVLGTAVGTGLAGAVLSATTALAYARPTGLGSVGVLTIALAAAALLVRRAT